MFSRILTASVAALAFGAAALAQTGTSGTMNSTGDMHAPMKSSGSASSGMNGNAAMSGQMAQQPGGFNPSMYKSQTDCLNAAQAAHASMSACKGIKTK